MTLCNLVKTLRGFLCAVGMLGFQLVVLVVIHFTVMSLAPSLSIKCEAEVDPILIQISSIFCENYAKKYLLA